MAHAAFVQAVQCLVRDPDKKYDEVLVDRFADLIRLELEATPAKDWQLTAAPLVDTLQLLMDDKAFVMFDRARAFKLLRAIVDSKPLNRKEFESLQPLLDSFWRTVPSVLMNHHLPAATVMLHILRSLWKTRFAHEWLLARRIVPRLRINNVILQDIASLAKYYMKSGNNYHTKNRAEELFQELLSSSYMMNLPPEHPLVSDLLETVQELLLEGSDTIVTVIMKLLGELDSRNFCTKYGLSDMVQECFEASVKNPKCNFIILCKCLALSGKRKFLDHNIELLKANYRVEALIIYLISRPHYWEHCDLNEFVETCLMYPILSTCYDSDSKEMISKLQLNALDRQQIDKCNHPRLTLHCLIHLNQLLQDQKLIESQLKLSTLPILVRMIRNFIKTHLDSIKHYKSIFESMKTLRYLLELQYNSKLEIFNCIMDLFEVIQDGFIDNRKPILVSFFSLLQYMNEKMHRCKLDKQEEMQQRKSMYEKVANMALKYNDVDILEEFFNFFTKSKSIIEDGDMLTLSPEIYVDLMLNHMLPRLKEAESAGQALGRLLVELTNIDYCQRVEKCLLNDFNSIDFIKMIGDILIERATDYNVIEPVIEKFHQSSYLFNGDPQDLKEFDDFNWDEPAIALYPFEEKSLNRVVLGFCTAIWKADLPEKECLDGVKVMLKMAQIIIKTSSSPRRALGRLVKTGILATVHGIASTSSYSGQTTSEANRIAYYISQNIEMEHLDECIFDELKVYHPDCENPDLDKVRKRASKLALFFGEATSVLNISPMSHETQEACKEETSHADNITTMVYNFLHYPDHDNTMDCH